MQYWHSTLLTQTDPDGQTNAHLQHTPPRFTLPSHHARPANGSPMWSWG